MMMLNLRRSLIAVPAALLFFVAVAQGQELQAGETATFSGQGVTAAHSVTQLVLTPDTPNILKFGQNITVNFSYDTTQVGGVRIFVRPISLDALGNDMLTPNYAACPSPLYPTGSGTGSCTLTITDVDANVDKLRIQMWDANQTVRLFNMKVPVSYKFR
ncbi:MAG TPA: hypothetical protein VH436_01985 [Vicinamibacterales bacterium]|jgi:hypothetical protein